jgi:hypothetical protein
MSASSSPAASNKPVDFAALHAQILATLATALHSASLRLRNSTDGHSTFTSDADLKAALALLKLAPDLLPLLKQSAPAPPPPVPYREQPGFQIPLIPKCPICNKGPGAHWPDRCPDNPDWVRPGSQKL